MSGGIVLYISIKIKYALLYLGHYLLYFDGVCKQVERDTCATYFLHFMKKRVCCVINISCSANCNIIVMLSRNTYIKNQSA